VTGKNVVEQKDIVLFYSDWESILKREVLRGLSYEVYNPPPFADIIRQNAYRFVLFCFRKEPFWPLKVVFARDFLRAMARDFKWAIMAEDIKRLKPKVVLTAIYNSDDFHHVSDLCADIPFLAITNSATGTWCASNGYFSADEFYCFGPRVERIYREAGHRIKKFVHCGSLVAGLALTKGKLNPDAEKKYDICLVSQWHNVETLRELGQSIWRQEGNPFGDFRKSFPVLDNYLARYVREHDVSVCIALRGGQPGEREYFESVFQEKCTIIESNRKSFSSFQACSQSELVIGINSGLIVTVFGMGIKTLSVNPVGSKWLQQMDSAGLWYLESPSYEEFAKRVDCLLAMKTEDYCEVARQEMENVYTFDSDMPAHILIRKRLLDLVSEPN